MYRIPGIHDLQLAPHIGRSYVTVKTTEGSCILWGYCRIITSSSSTCSTQSLRTLSSTNLATSCTTKGHSKLYQPFTAIHIYFPTRLFGFCDLLLTGNKSKCGHRNASHHKAQTQPPPAKPILSLMIRTASTGGDRCASDFAAMLTLTGSHTRLTPPIFSHHATSSSPHQASSLHPTSACSVSSPPAPTTTGA
jgi:hypothetical protein